VETADAICDGLVGGKPSLPKEVDRILQVREQARKKERGRGEGGEGEGEGEDVMVPGRFLLLPLLRRS